MTETKKPELPEIDHYRPYREQFQSYSDACVAHATAEKDATIKRQQKMLEKIFAKGWRAYLEEQQKGKNHEN